MNNKRRVVLNKQLEILQQVYDEVSYIRDEEEDSMVNLPENLQGSEQYDKMEAAVDNLESAINNIEEAVNNIENALE